MRGTVIALALLAASVRIGHAQLPMSRVLTLDVAEIIAQGALEKCHADGLKIAVLVVDALNAPKVLIRDDGATAATAEAARMKATTAVLYERPSGPANPPPPGSPVPAAPIPGTFMAQGGVPIKVNGFTIGAVGVSATQSPNGGQVKDAACASAGIAKAADKLR
jgi:glc operon protein GlcG